MTRYEEIERILALFSHKNVEILAADREISNVASSIRADHNLKLPDAFIVATAVVNNCDALIGNDKMCAQRVTEVPYIYLKEP